MPKYSKSCTTQEYIDKNFPDSEVWVTTAEPDMLERELKVRAEQLEGLTDQMYKSMHTALDASDDPIAVYYQDQLLWISGVVKLWPGVGEFWMLTDDKFPEFYKKEPKVFIKGIRHWLRGLNYHRIQTPVRADFETGLRFVKFFGFEEEGLMRKYGPDKVDFVRFAYIKD